jgi:hypothetical protein
MSDNSEVPGQGHDPLREVGRLLDEIDGDEGSSGFDWVKALPVALSFAGIVLYGVITIADERFYEALGVTGGDVGLSYANTLVRASGLVIMFGVLAALILFLLVFPRASLEVSPQEMLLRAREGPEFREELVAVRLKARARKKFQKAVRRRTYFLMGVLTFVLLAAILPVLYLNAANRASLVSQGHSVGPVRLLGLTILPISAYPASVQWVSPNGAPALPHNLLFLGQAGGSTPLYDPALKQVIWLPSDLITVSVGRCPQGAEVTTCHPAPAPTHSSSPSSQPTLAHSSPTRTQGSASPSEPPITPPTGPTLPGRA